MVELIHLAKNFINADDAIIAKKKGRELSVWKQISHAILSRVLI